MQRLAEFVAMAERLQRTSSEALHFAQRGEDAFVALSLQLLERELGQISASRLELLRFFQTR